MSNINKEFDIEVHYDDLASNVLLEDNHLLLVNKPPSEIVQGDKTGDIPLSEKYKHFLKKKHNKPGSVFLGVTHRIDRPTSGVVIFAKTGKALSRMNSMLQQHEVSKFYWAVVGHKPEKAQGRVAHHLVRNPQKNKSYAFNEPQKNSKKAEMIYRVLGSSDRYHLLEVEIITGRHHQIRSQLAAMGSPVKGDIKYGFHTTNKDASIHLHARKVEFQHPVKDEKITIVAPVPNEKLWKFFENRFSDL